MSYGGFSLPPVLGSCRCRQHGVVGLATAAVSLARSRGRNGSLWIAAFFAVLVVGVFLRDD